MENFRKLRVWQKAHALVRSIYKITLQFPDAEKFGLTSQMRRASISVSANIAEGSKRITNKDKRRYNIIAEGSLEEIKYYLILSFDLKYLSAEQDRKLMESAREVGKLLSGYTRYIQRGIR